MNMMSSYNTYYRYLIETANDLLPSTFSRRSDKALYNHKSAFFFEVLSTSIDPTLLYDFFNSRLTKDDLLFLNINLYEIFPILHEHPAVFLVITEESQLKILEKIKIKFPGRNFSILLIPATKKVLKSFVDFYKNKKTDYNFYFRFLPYDSNLVNSITVSDINSFDVDYPVLSGLEIYNNQVPKHYEMQPEVDCSYSIKWSHKVEGSRPTISVIIPTYNNSLFLSNVIWHLSRQNCPRYQFEVIIADDGSQDSSCEIIQDLFSSFSSKFNITYIYWNKLHPLRGEQFFFRSGLARNLGSKYSRGEYLLFLDSDMLVPSDFIDTALSELNDNDIIQFQRFHIHQELSKQNPAYENIQVDKDTYIEERNYWSQLFYANNWTELTHYWKYTCTYALGIKKRDFLTIGMFKKYYISYGFEDTDLGYEAHKRSFKFKLVKRALLHLTAYDQMQYKNSFRKRVSLLRVTAELFYLQHLNKEVYSLLGDYLRMQKPIKAFFRDLVS